VTLDDVGLPFASHLPFLIDPARGACGTLMAHMARANPQHWDRQK
jgi:transcriptional regulator